MNDRITLIFNLCAEITKSKGFDVTQHNSQLLLIASEIAEALENHSVSSNMVINSFHSQFINLMNDFEDYRKRINPNEFEDYCTVLNQNQQLEELADAFIRIGSYVSGNGLIDKFLAALLNKISKNKQRPVRHGKGF
jgi:hypothetical protein